MTDRSWLAPALFWVLAITGFRIATQAWNRADLFVDEAQYWLWGQELAFGYYSKPPMIGWVIRAVTDLAGSDAPFWVRLPAPVFHGITALILGGIANRLFGRSAAIVATVGYLTLPVIAVGSFLISTDTIMFPFLAGALALYLRQIEAEDESPRWWALACGVCLGLAFLSKYAAVYYLLCAAIVWLTFPAFRPPRGRAGLILLAFALTIAPNILWNLLNGLTTVSHTLDNADWVRDPGSRAALNFAGLAEFLASQLVVFGPVLFPALLVMGWQGARRRLTLPQTGLLVFALPIVALVCVQALLSQAYANWAAAAYLAGSVAVLPWLLGQRRLWLTLSFALNGAICLALPLAGMAADRFSLTGKTLLLQRYAGLDELSVAILAHARDAGLDVIVASDRDILADLFYTGRASGIAVFAAPYEGRPPHHYALKHELPAPASLGSDRLLYVLKSGRSLPCEGVYLGSLEPKKGRYRGKTIEFLDLPADCWGDTRATQGG